MADDPWRRWIDDRFLNELDWRPVITNQYWLGSHELGTDNPDQRTTEDIRDLLRHDVVLTLGLISRVVTLFSFLTTLWGLSDACRAVRVSIPATSAGSRWFIRSSARLARTWSGARWRR